MDTDHKSHHHKPHGHHRAAVSVHAVEKSFGEGEARTRALKNTHFEARHGELIMLVGPSGCGKTTLLSIIAGTLHADAGEVHALGKPLHTLSERDLTRFRADNLGFVFQSFNLIPTLTCVENVSVPLLIQGKPRREAESRAAALLERVGLKGREEARPSQLSGGQQQRVAIARALVHEPRLLICDEPTSALDRHTGAQVMELIRELTRSPDRCVVVVTHDHRIFRFADRIAEMEDGRIRHVWDDPHAIANKYS